jgi:NADH:ubiquinone oxidoreductase subunit 2 (subunit N)
LFTFLFILEFTSVIIFYKFVVSKIWVIKNNNDVNNFTLFRNLPNYYLNMLFFQYWATFFSSVLIVFSLISFIYMYSSTEWFLLNLLNKFNLQINSNQINNLILVFTLLFGFLIKVGFTPIHLYKIEIYKGLPFFAIFFYTTYYFLVFFMFFILLVLLFFESFSIYWLYILSLISFCGLLFIITLLFGVNYIKAFFAYSSVVNSLGFIIIIIALFN